MRNKGQMQVKRAYILQSFLGQMKAKLLQGPVSNFCTYLPFFSMYSATQYVQHARLRKKWGAASFWS